MFRGGASSVQESVTAQVFDESQISEITPTGSKRKHTQQTNVIQQIKYKPSPKYILQKRMKLNKNTDDNDFDTEDDKPLINFKPEERLCCFLSTSSNELIDPDDLVPLNLRQKKSQIPRQRTVKPPTKAPALPSLAPNARQHVHLPINDYVRFCNG